MAAEDRHTKDKRRLVRNTFTMYFRTALAMIVGLIVTRLLLQQLGDNTYGLYNVVAGVVVLFTFINASMSQAIQRFITFSLGKNEDNQTRLIFSTSFISQVSFTIFLVILCETIGLWFINTKIDSGGISSYIVNISFQLSVLTFAINFIRVPFEAIIIAYEKMTFFAYATILDSLLKLAIVYLLSFSHESKLISYCCLLVLESFIMLCAYFIYARKHFTTCRILKQFDKGVLKEIVTFSGWNILGSVSNIVSQKGIVFFLNIFTGLTHLK